MGIFDVFQSKGDGVPSWLQGRSGSFLLSQMGALKDYMRARALLAVKARFPFDEKGLPSPDDALAVQGVERLMARGPSESSSSYAGRLQGAWDTWPNAGKPLGLLRALSTAGYPNVALLQAIGGFYSLDAGRNLVKASSQNWVMDANVPPGSPVPWRPTISPGRIVLPSVKNGFWYRTNAPGVTGAVEPAWPTAVGLQVLDAGLTWVCGGRTLWNRCDVLFYDPLPASWGNGASVPASGSDEAKTIRSIVNLWMPGFGSVNRYIIKPSTGKLVGWPARNLGAGNGTIGSTNVTYWSP